MSSLLSGRNVRWPRHMVSHGEYADGQADGRTPGRCITLSARRGRRNNKENRWQHWELEFELQYINNSEFI